MAFNPFHQFRRYNKAIFAILAIICMFTFVLSSGMGGGGDLFTQIGDWLGGRAGANTLISVGGKNFDAREVDQIRIQRSLASDYMDNCVAASQANLMGRVNAGMEKLDPTARQFVGQIVQMKMFAQMVPSMQQQYVEIVRNAARYDQVIMNFLASAQRENRTDDVNTLAGIRTLLLQDYRQLGRRGNESYFGGRMRERDLESTAEFLMWLHQADQLGIKLTRSDIAQEIADETGGITAESATAIDRGLRERYAGFSADSLYAALGDELRVRMAQAAFLGTAARTRTGSPSVLTPEEEWDLFKDARTTIRVGLIELPVDSFLSQVTGKPTNEELKKLFDEHKNDEPLPYLERPGFKEPRRIQVEWVNGKADSAFYQKAAVQLMPVFQTIRLFGLASPGEAALAPLALDAELYYAQRDYLFRESPWSDPFFPRVHDTSIVQAQNLKMLVGATLAAAGTGAPVLSGPLSFEGSILFTETLERSKLGLAMLGFGASDAYGATAAALALTPQPLGIDVLRQPLRDKASVALGKGLLEADLVAFRAKIAELGKEKDKTPLRKTVDEFIAQRGMFRGATTELRDRFNLVDDPGMTKLKDIYLHGHRDDPLGLGFGAPFFEDPARFGGVSTYNPREFPTTEEEGKFIFWLTEDRADRVPKFENAKLAVENAWRKQKARQIAKESADKLMTAVKNAQGDIPKLRDLAAQNGDRTFFELGPLAKRMPVPSAIAGGARQYQGPTIPQERIAFPSDELLTGLLELRKEARGAATVLADMPKTHYYVTSLIFRDEPSQDEFRRAYVGSMARAIEVDRLLPELAMDSRIKFQRETVKQLRESAKVKINQAAVPAPTPASSEPDIPVEG
jgi:hypothetical protein